MKHPHPPHWADRFLGWYCNPELLEEIQGDAYELYYERLERKGKVIADLFYIWDIVRFCRLSNIERRPEYNEAGFFGLLWNINFKLALRNARRNKVVFAIKVSALALCMAFTLLLTALVIHDTTYDHHYSNYKQLYRVGCRVDFQGKQSNYAVSPLPMGAALADEVTGVSGYARFMIIPHLSFKVDDKSFYGITTYVADTNFLKLFRQQFLEGTGNALDEPNRMVITESVAQTMFGFGSAVGKTVDLGWTSVEVSGVIRDLPSNTHFTFQALISWDTFDRQDEWQNINAYTYIQVQPGTDLVALDSAISITAGDYLKPMSDDYKFSFQPILQRIDEIHLSGFMDEDFAIKRNRSYIYIILSVMVLFLLTGLFNYLNLALTELTLQLRTISILKAFGGYQANHQKIAFTEALLSLLIAVPAMVFIIGLVISQPGLFPVIDHTVWSTKLFLAVALGMIAVVIAASGANGLIASSSALRSIPSKGIATRGQHGLGLRKFLVASQLAFSIIMIGLITVILQQFQFVRDADMGFESSHVLVIKRAGSSETNQALENSIRSLPGVQQVAGTSFYPEGGVETKDMFDVETATGHKTLLWNFIKSEKDYPDLLGMRLVKGRLFGKEEDSENKRSFLINEAAAKLLGWTDPIGRTIHFPVTDDGTGGEIVGESLHSTIEPLVIVFTPGKWGINFIYVKSDPLRSAGLMEDIQKEFKKVNPDGPFEGSYLQTRYQSLYKDDYELKDVFYEGLILSVVVSVLGIFSISALVLSLRNREMGIRKVVGAENVQLFLLHLKPFAVFFLMSVGIGLPFVIYLSQKWLNNFAYHITLSPLSFVLPVICTLLIILVATGYHAVRCTLVNPVDILKEE